MALFARCIGASIVISFLPAIVDTKFPCMNDGEPALSESAEFTCRCKPGFDGPLCEYEGTSHRARASEGFDHTVMNILLCVFFLLLLPTMIIYLIRTIYLSLKRCGTVLQQQQRHRMERTQSFGVVCGPSPPMRYSLGNERCTHAFAASPVANCRPLHGTQSMTIRNTPSLSTEQFNEILLSLQQSLEQLRQVPTDGISGAGDNGQQHRPPPPPPPPYESVAMRPTNSRTFWAPSE